MTKPITEPGTVESTRVYTGRVINLDVDEVRFPNGHVGKLEMIRHPGASAVVPFLTDPRGEDPQLLLIRQYRYATDGFVYEIPAGRLEPGEDPAHCARRELEEETGCSAEHVEHLFTMYTTPGFTDEKIHLFMASGLTTGETRLEADEIAEVQTFPLSKVLEMIQHNEIVDCKTALAILYVAGFTLGR